MNPGASGDPIPEAWRSFPEVIPPFSSGIFEERAGRFEALARESSLSGWLTFLGRITLSQHRLLQDYPALPLNPDRTRRQDNQAAPFSAAALPRDPVWRQALASLIGDILPHAPAPAKDALAFLRAQNGAFLEELADQILRMEFSRRQVHLLPYISAALQVHFTALAAAAGKADILRPDAPGVCPCCGFLPVGSVLRTDGDVPRLRYLHCGLCNTQWHLVRVTCAACGENGHGISYRYIEGTDGAVRAEACAVCKSYLKIIYPQASPTADPVADDLATLPLDLLLEEAGYNRMSPNLLFAHAS
ncbi:MAG: formate dehydrogenase accessory protein FdhE [Deltaproteobacteria bacterium]|nr:formate dehydrogenase accessory protein FdhE [Deltaproteobacteria bacterium]